MITKKKILVLATYPISTPLHGGQKRTRAIVEFYKGIFEEVRFAAVFHKKYYDDYAPEDIAVEDADIIARIESDPFLGDILCGEAIYADATVKQKMIGLLKDYQPHIIQIEQGYPYLGLEPLLSELGMEPKLIYSSHNVEHVMKREIYSSLGIPKEKAGELVGRIEGLEKLLAGKARLVIAVSPEDSNVYGSMGAKKRVVAPNGIEKVIPTEAALKHWQKFKKDQGVKRLVTFVGSAHPPNLIGFQKLVGEDLGFIPDDTRVMLAGGISDYMQEAYKTGTAKAAKFWKRAVPLGKLSDDNLAALIIQSDLLLLPIISGGGSNLKTAEAILSGRKVLGTSYAFRSYERYQGLPNIRLTDDGAEFRRQIPIMLDTPYIERSAEQAALADQVQWQYCLRPLVKTPLYVSNRAVFVTRRIYGALRWRIARLLGRG